MKLGIVEKDERPRPSTYNSHYSHYLSASSELSQEMEASTSEKQTPTPISHDMIAGIRRIGLKK